MSRASYDYSWRTFSQWAHLTPLALHMQARFIDDEEELVVYTNEAIDTAYKTLAGAVLLTVERSRELDPELAPITAAMQKFVTE